MRKALFSALICLPFLAACSGEDTAKLQQAASAAIGVANSDSSASLSDLKAQASAAIGELKAQVKDGSAPVAELKSQASAAFGVAKKLGEAAAIVNPELKEQVDTLKQQASDAKAVLKILGN